ncbi:MAG: MFS transporter, partial [Rhodoplanes sp.]
MLSPDTFALTALLALLTALGPLAMDLYLPSLPAIEAALAASTAQVQLTISVYLIGFAIGQVVYGPVSDRFGRKPVLSAALTIFCVGTLVCSIAPTIGALIAARAFQGAGAAGVIVLARAIVRDLYEGPRAGRELSLMGAIMGIAPIVAPTIGGFTQTNFGWR